MSQVPPEDHEAVRACRSFAIEGRLTELVPFERGHIHDTFTSTWLTAGGDRRFLHQRMNPHVFRDIDGLMHNIESITSHLHRKEAVGSFRTLKLVTTHAGDTYHVDRGGGAWRTYEFIENTESFDVCSGPEQAREAARVFGLFQAMLTDIDVAGLLETIPSFFSSPHRYRQLADAVDLDAADRVAGASREISFARERHDLVHVFDGKLAAGTIPLRVVHGDTKLNNVLFDHETGKAVAVVDLDTCMPGYSLYDFGDLVRFTAATSREDETDLDRVEMDLELYNALVDGYLHEARGFLTRDELELMPVAARLVTLTIGLRFLADHLAGDHYFKVAYPGHNLDRCRVQFKLVTSMERQAGAMRIRSDA